MSWMFTRSEGLDGFVNLRSVLLDDRSWTTPFVETHTREKLPWASTPAVHSFEALPRPDAFPVLIAEFQSQPRP